MAEERVLIRVDHGGRSNPADGQAIMRQLQERLFGHGARAAHLRVSTVALEFDLYVESRVALESALAILKDVGPLLTHRFLDAPAESVPILEAVTEARRFFNEQRFWEVHEALEAIWKAAQGAEKRGIQGLILVAAALVHGQRHEPIVMTDMLRDARPRLDLLPENYLGWDVAGFKACVDRWTDGQKTPFPTTKDFLC